MVDAHAPRVGIHFFIHPRTRQPTNQPTNQTMLKRPQAALSLDADVHNPKKRAKIDTDADDEDAPDEKNSAPAPAPLPNPRRFRLFRLKALAATRAFVVGVSAAARSSTTTSTPLERFATNRVLFDPNLVFEIAAFTEPRIRSWTPSDAPGVRDIPCIKAAIEAAPKITKQTAFMAAAVAIHEASDRVVVALIPTRQFGPAYALCVFDLNGALLAHYEREGLVPACMHMEQKRQRLYLWESSTEQSTDQCSVASMPVTASGFIEPRGETHHYTPRFFANKLVVHPDEDRVYAGITGIVCVTDHSGRKIATINEASGFSLDATSGLLWASSYMKCVAYDAVNGRPARTDQVWMLGREGASRIWVMCHIITPVHTSRGLHLVARPTSRNDPVYALSVVDISNPGRREELANMIQNADVAAFYQRYTPPTMRVFNNMFWDGLRRFAIHSTSHYAFVMDSWDGEIFVLAPGWSDLA